MVIQLGVVCTGTVRVKEFLKKIDEVIHGGHTHFQFNTVYSCKVRVMLQRTIAKKKAWQSVSVDVEEIDQGEDSEGEDYNDEEMAEQVGSHF
jgi:DNA-directed RNA polymerase beta' subunit